MSNKIGRNDVCHCGSGLKYKRCCGQKNMDREVMFRRAAILYPATSMRLLGQLKTRTIAFDEFDKKINELVNPAKPDIDLSEISPDDIKEAVMAC